MTQDEFNQKQAAGEVQVIEPQVSQNPPQPSAPNPVEEYLTVLEALRRPRASLTTAPTFIPQTLTDQIQFYDDGVNRRLYLYVNKVWRYVALT